ncbi:Lactamase-like protein [Lachnellula occidentalis]|uniref:Lactamase-like protein n=1 Tax=Lachnellula occidentalis TaxID=215460 RepID=A0A8H8RRK5_9HELO|nr:Lactamase-like protein [Lachnellula occidentalis]
MAPGKGGYRQINKAFNICAFDDYLEGQRNRLPKLQDIEQISSRFTLQGTNTYIVGTGSRRLIIDTGQGVPEWADLISSTLTTSEISLSHVLLTHWHGDHTGGVPDLTRMYPDVSSSIYKHTPSKSQLPITDSQIFEVEGATIRAVHTPGHSHDHICFILEEEEAMFTGDVILGHGTTVVEHLSTWMETLHKIQSYNCVKGYPAHGSIIADLPAKIKGELALKRRRERRVLQSLEQAKREGRAAGGRGKGSITVTELVTAMHGTEIDQGIRELALEPFMDEVLRKLAEDGSVAFEMRGGVKKWFAIERI